MNSYETRNDIQGHDFYFEPLVHSFHVLEQLFSETLKRNKYFKLVNSQLGFNNKGEFYFEDREPSGWRKSWIPELSWNCCVSGWRNRLTINLMILAFPQYTANPNLQSLLDSLHLFLALSGLLVYTSSHAHFFDNYIFVLLYNQIAKIKKLQQGS